MRFKEHLDFGKTAETAIAAWLRSKNYSVLPVYEKVIDEGKGPQVFLPNNVSLIAPDLLAFKTEKAIWIEAKHKTAFSWHRITNRWVTGIDLRHYIDYCKIDDLTPWPVWLLFLHRGGQAKDSPPNSPSGLFGNVLSKLRRMENHRHGNWGRTGMVYWAIDSLIKLAEYEEVMEAYAKTSLFAKKTAL